MDKTTKKDQQKDGAVNILLNLELKPTKPVKEAPKASKFKNNLVKGYKPGDNRQVTHNLRRRMGR